VDGIVPIWVWLLAGTAIVLLSAFLYWAFVITEGAYFGSRVVAWTYDLAASKYDSIKQFRPLDDAWLLASPMMNELREVNGPLVLDVAVGTGRMPLALLSHSRFRGYIIGLDLSWKMLEQAQQKLGEHVGRYTLLWHDAHTLPFPDETFDAISCLEALEFMSRPQRVLDEMARVLRPGGVLLVTNRVNWERVLMPGKAFEDDALRGMLRQAGLVNVVIRPWQVYYDLIWARKPGERSRLGRATHQLGQVLCCPQCGHTPLERGADSYQCTTCGRTYPLQGSILRTG
jgi:ubiquinone/menaquinone biosynthesis C-methylase UbiE